MSFLASVTDEAASGEVLGQYDADRARLGYVANYTRTFSLRPNVFAAWGQLSGAVKAGMDPRRYEVATLAAARVLRSSYCALAHGQILAEQHMDEQSVRDLMHASVGSALDRVDAAIAELAAKVATDAPGITESDFASLRELGLTDTDIFDVVLTAAVRCFFSTVLDATGTRPDQAYDAMFEPATREALTVGRPIADAD
jgi:uncharacterized peroxidase-related enzyme